MFALVDDEMSSLYGFLAELPKDIELFVNSNNCNLVMEADKRQRMGEERYSILINDAYKETFENHYFVMRDFERKADSKIFRNRLKSAGMSGASLKLKALRLRELYEKLYDKAANFIDINKQRIRKLASLFLEHIASILGSLSKLFPQLEKIIEPVEVIKSMVDELGVENA